MRLELTRRASYAIRAAVVLARNEGVRELTSSTRIAIAMGIPPRFLPQVMGDLVRAGLVEGRVGRAGGYRLVRDPATVSLLGIIEAAEGDTRRRFCVLRGMACDALGTTCDVHEVFAKAEGSLLEQLERTTLADVVASDGHGRTGPSSDGASAR
jgi:Rrf2 family protein